MPGKKWINPVPGSPTWLLVDPSVSPLKHLAVVYYTPGDGWYWSLVITTEKRYTSRCYPSARLAKSAARQLVNRILAKMED